MREFNIKKYLITSPSFYTDDSLVFQETLEKQYLKHKPDYILYRDKENTAYDELSETFIKVCKSFGDVKSFLHQNVELASRLGADGVHLTSTQFEKIEYAKSLGLEVIVSTHALDEVLKAQALGASAVTYSPVFFSPDKGEPKGIENLKEVISQTSIHIFALGGIINKEEVNEIKKVAPYGFASIRYFY